MRFNSVSLRSIGVAGGNETTAVNIGSLKRIAQKSQYTPHGLVSSRILAEVFKLTSAYVNIFRGVIVRRDNTASVSGEQAMFDNKVGPSAKMPSFSFSLKTDVIELI